MEYVLSRPSEVRGLGLTPARPGTQVCFSSREVPGMSSGQRVCWPTHYEHPNRPCSCSRTNKYDNSQNVGIRVLLEASVNNKVVLREVLR